MYLPQQLVRHVANDLGLQIDELSSPLFVQVGLRIAVENQRLVIAEGENHLIHAVIKGSLVPLPAFVVCFLVGGRVLHVVKEKIIVLRFTQIRPEFLPAKWSSWILT